MSEMFRKYKLIDTAKQAQEEMAAQKKKREEDSIIHAAMTPLKGSAHSSGSGRANALVIVALVLAVASFGLGFKLALDVSGIQSNFNEMQAVVDDRADEAGQMTGHVTAVEDEFRRGFKKDRERLETLEKGAQATVDLLAGFKDVVRTADLEKISKSIAEQKESVVRLQQRVDNIVAENKKLSDQIEKMQSVKDIEKNGK